jgi:Winged helix DNA-binding domain
VAVGAERVLTQRERNRALLERQGLIERKRLALPRALERFGGIQAQYAPSMYIGLWARIAGFERASLTRALERRTVIQGTLMRTTIHLVSREDFWPIALAIRDVRRAGWLAYRRGKATERDVLATAKLVRARLAAGATTRADLGEGLDAMMFNGAGVWLDLVRIPPSGTWERRRADMYALAEEWVGPAGDATAETGLRLLIDRYLRGFGPARAADIANWIGVSPGPVAAALEDMELRHFRDEQGGLLVDLPRLALPGADTPAPVRFLPTWDATLLVHARATGILAEEDRPKVFSTKTPQSVPTFTVDGTVAGTWRHSKGQVKLAPFAKLAGDARAALSDEADRLAALHA